MNNIFLNLIENKQKNPFDYDYVDYKINKKIKYPFKKKNKLSKSQSVGNIEDNPRNILAVDYAAPLRDFQEEMKAYLFQNQLDKRRQEYLIDEQLGDIKNEIKNRLSRLENQQKLQIDSLAYCMKHGNENNFERLTKDLFTKIPINDTEEYYERKLDDLLKFDDDKRLYRSYNYKQGLNGMY